MRIKRSRSRKLKFYSHAGAGEISKIISKVYFGTLDLAMKKKKNNTKTPFQSDTVRLNDFVLPFQRNTL